jgi:4-alpha-glucanotransferase
MWLPETAVDLETLDILAENEIRFTILAPHQASRVRPIASGKWRDVSGGRIDPTMAYEVHLPSGRMMSVADIVIFPMQDLLGLGGEARMNRPATAGGNWQWRFLPEQVTESLVERLGKMTEIYGRT